MEPPGMDKLGVQLDSLNSLPCFKDSLCNFTDRVANETCLTTMFTRTKGAFHVVPRRQLFKNYLSCSALQHGLLSWVELFSDEGFGSSWVSGVLPKLSLLFSSK